MIRPFIDSDRIRLIEILQLNVPDNFAPSEVADFQSYIQSNGDTYFVIEKDTKIVGGFGYLLLEKSSEAAIKWIFTHPEYTGTGLGRMAVEHCLELFRSRFGVETVMVDTSQLACKFFSKFGFSVILEEKDYWAKGFDLVRMKLKLAQY